MARQRRAVTATCSAVVLLALAAGMPPAEAASAGVGDGALTVRVVNSVDGSGAYTPAIDTGISGAPVAVTDATGHSVTGMTGGDGTLSVDLSGLSGGKYRVQVSAPPRSGLSPAPAGKGLSSTVDFVDVSGGKSASPVVGLWEPSTYCQADPTLVTCNLERGDRTGDPGLFSFNSSTALSATPPGGPYSTLTKVGDQGAVFGVGTDRTGNVYMGTYVKRHTEYGPAGPVNAIYRYNTTAPGSVSTFVTLPGALTPHSKAGAVPYKDDDAVYDKIGEEGLGDVDVSGDGSTLYAVDINNSSLYEVPIVGSGPSVTAGAPTGHVIPRPASGCVGNWHPFGLGVRGSRVLVGGICGAESTVTTAAPWGDPSQERGFVYDYSNGAFSQIFSFPLNYPRGCAYLRKAAGGGNCNPKLGGLLSAYWEAWNTRDPQSSFFSSGPQPMLSNLELTDSGSLVIALRDRYPDMEGTGLDRHDSTSVLVYAIAAGDMLAACPSGGGFTLESNGSCGGVTGAAPGNGFGPGGGEFYNNVTDVGDAFHDHTGTGATAYLPGYGKLWETRYDPFTGDPWHKGVSVFSATGSPTGSIELNGVDAGTNVKFGKGNSLSDLELLCDQAPVQIGNRVWFDTDHDGVQDAGEPAVPGVAVTLKECTGKSLATATTDANGEYYFGTADGVKPNTCYNVSFDYSKVPANALPSGLTAADVSWTKQNAGPDRCLDSDVNSSGVASVTVGKAGDVNHCVDAGLVGPPNSVGDYVWYDANRNGIQDAGEPGVPGAVATLKDAGGKVIGTATTDASGKYLFGDLPDGTYQVCFGLAGVPSKYAGAVFTRQNAASHNGTDSAADPATGCTMTTTLGPDHRQDLTLDAGILTPTNSVGDLVWYDANRTGIRTPSDPGVPGAVATLKDAGGKVVATATTDASGKYLFGDLPDGTYQVCFGLGGIPSKYAGAVFTRQNAAGHNGTDSAANPASGCTMTTTLGPGHRQDLTLDTGILTPTNSVGDLVWYDRNSTGVYRSGEGGVPNVEVTLKDSAGVVQATMRTDASGKYLFGDLPDGTYQVCFNVQTLPAGYAFTRQNAAGHNGTDSAANPASGCTMTTTLGPGHRQDLTLDAGILRPGSQPASQPQKPHGINLARTGAQLLMPGVLGLILLAAGGLTVFLLRRRMNG
jgi:hypothetical protein